MKIGIGTMAAIGMLMLGQAYGQKPDPAMYNCLKWRMIGPYRGGRTVGASGSWQQPNVFYMGVNNGGVWKTTDYGHTWKPIFDDQPIGSIGDVAVAPSNPNTLYVASGEGLQRPDLSVGDGMYKSTDGGNTWRHLGLQDGRQIGGISIDPNNENRVFAAVLGHPYGPNTERGVYRTTDGGQSWQKVLYIDENTGAIQVTIDPTDPSIVYADMFAGRLAPWENGQWAGKNSGLFKSIDGGNTWHQLKNGLPTPAQGLDRIGFCIAPSLNSRLYAVVSANAENGGLYRSDDGGENWKKMTGDHHLWDRGTDFAEVKADPKNPDKVYVANVMCWKSMDGGKTWDGFKGAPGGDDYHRFWINPQNTDIMLLANDQGAIVTVNGGETWSSWYNQPTAQLYHVSADNDFPYNVYSGQQESGSVGISSRGNDGAITFRDWHPVGAEEYGYVVADPLDPKIVYGGKISRHDKRTGQTQNIAPEALRSGKYRFIRTAPVVFSPADNKTLYYAGNVVFKTRNGGKSWDIISPDLTRKSYQIPPCIGVYADSNMKTMPQRGVIYTLAPSPLDTNILWAGTDDGLIQVTTNGGATWQDVTPPQLASWCKVSLMDASHTQRNTAYAAVNCIRLDDQRPHIYRTHDGGKTWKEISHGLPNDPINVVKEDPIRPGLLFAGSERAVYFSLDDGENWQTLRLNMPATSIRDLCIKDNDLVVATHGRSFWILDDISALRQLHPDAAKPRVLLYRPGKATRVRWNMNTDTPLPPEEPTGLNPPDGAVIDYYLAGDAQNVTLEIVDMNGNTVRKYTSHDTMYKIPDVNIPHYWIRPQQILPTSHGSHRWVWDLHYAPLNEPMGYPIAAIYQNTAPTPTGPWAMPGSYTVKLTVNGKKYGEPLTVAMDPRVKTSRADLQTQHDLSVACYKRERWIMNAMELTRKFKDQLTKLQLKADTATKARLATIIQDLDAIASTDKNSTFKGLSGYYGALRHIFDLLQEADVPPTDVCLHDTETVMAAFDKFKPQWSELEDKLMAVKGLTVWALPVW